ncbi:MAG: hypothetical protein CMO81_06090 [Waddliaceae bacterium]|nr:hypothetical protein [Waddliaceae bacterium]
MSQQYKELMDCLQAAIDAQKGDKLSKSDIKKVVYSAHNFFDGGHHVEQKQLEEIRDAWVELAEGKIDKARAMKKLQGTSRAEAMGSVLSNLI